MSNSFHFSAFIASLRFILTGRLKGECLPTVWAFGRVDQTAETRWTQRNTKTKSAQLGSKSGYCSAEKCLHLVTLSPCHLVTVALFVTTTLYAQLQLVPDDVPQAILAGEARTVRVMFHNPDAQTSESDLRIRLYQASSATAMPVGPARPWKTLTVLPKQTVIESLKIDVPAVRAKTRFEIRWLDGKDKSVGTTEISVYPEDMLKVLADHAGEQPIGVLDPENQLKPLLKKLEVQDLDAEAGLAGFAGKLAILGPFRSADKVPSGLAKAALEKARKSIVIIWLQPAPVNKPEPLPWIYPVRPGSGMIIVDRDPIMAQLPESAVAQLQLLRCVTLGFEPELLRLPGIEP